ISHQFSRRRGSRLHQLHGQHRRILWTQNHRRSEPAHRLVSRRIFSYDRVLDDRVTLGAAVSAGTLSATQRLSATSNGTPVLARIIQFAMSPESVTSKAPRMARSMWPPRICPNESALEKNAEPGIVVMVCFPALIRSASTSFSLGNGPMPSNPFSD